MVEVSNPISHLGMTSAFFLIFPFFYKINKQVRDGIISGIKKSFRSESSKIGSQKDEIKDRYIQVTQENINAFFEQEYKTELIPKLLAIYSLTVFFTINFYTYLLLNIKEHNSILDLINALDSFTAIPAILAYLLGLGASTILIIKRKTTIKIFLETTNLGLPKILSTETISNHLKLRLTLLIVGFAISFVVIFYILFMLGYYYLLTYLGLLSIYIAMMIHYLWFKFYIKHAVKLIDELHQD